VGSLRSLLSQRKVVQQLLGLRYFHSRFIPALEKIVKNPTKEVTLDLSNVNLFQVEILPWLIIAFDYYRNSYPSHQIKLKLPDVNTDAGHFLSIYHFDHILRHHLYLHKPDVIVDQSEWSRKLDESYVDKIKQHPLLYFLFHNKLAQLRKLTGKGSGSNLDLDICGRVRSEFIEAGLSGMGKIISRGYKIQEEAARTIATCIINEAILLLHQNQQSATLAFTVMGFQGNNLVFTTADNGTPLTELLYPWYAEKYNLKARHYKQLTPLAKSNLIKFTVDEETPFSIDRHSKYEKCLDLATQLKYIRRDTTDSERLGSLTLLTEGVLVKFLPGGVVHRFMPQPWRGNLLRISIPLWSRNSG
jgi:hypothetical protein